MWDPLDLCEHGARWLREREELYALEQSPTGIDSLSEREVQAILADGWRSAALRVWREWPFPANPDPRLRLTERERCDLILAPPGAGDLLDPSAELREALAAKGTLFESALPARRATSPADAFWLEIKVAGQFACVDAVPSPNRRYAHDLVGGLRADLAKLARDPAIVHAGAMLVLFTDSASTAAHDLAIAFHRLLDAGCEFRSPATRSFAIADRIGNGACTVALLAKR